ncbi:MAG: thermonuclease family protein [Blastocatellia bacterium]|nr:thermonuclease family protein [Blastocatellia bacterium]
MLELKKQETEEINPLPRWKIGVDRQQVAAYVGIALMVGFAFGFITARYITQKEVSSAATLNDKEPASEAAPADYHRVTRLLRADTLEVEGVGTVRMIGIETPDGKTPREIYEAHGQNALAFAEKSLRDQEIRLEFDPQNAGRANKDETGQTLAYIYTRDGTLFNAEMLKQGHAFVKISEPFQAINEFRALEREAIQAMRGVWGLSEPPSTVASTETSPLSATSQDDGRKKLAPLSPSEIGPNLPATSETGPPSEPMVYISPSDRMFHKSGCEYLDKKKQTTVATSKAKADNYAACGRCYASTVLRAP